MKGRLNIIIIGNGIAGITCARHVRKHAREASITVISSETRHFFSRTALMYIYMGHMKYEHTKPYEDSFWKKNRIQLRFARVERLDFERKCVLLEKGDSLSYDQLVLATGSKPVFADWPGQELLGAQALYSYQDLCLMEKNTKNIKRAVVVGGGLIGVEMAEMLLSRGIGVTYLVREPLFWSKVFPKEEAALVGRHMEEHHVDLRLSTELKEIRRGEGKERSERVGSVLTSQEEEIPCEFVGLTIGVRPNIDLVESTPLETNRGILVDEYLRTSVEDVYAIGDCAELRHSLSHRRAIEPVWYAGRMMGECLARTLTQDETPYTPGIWFNSAKFFDIEYQTYGMVSSKPKADEHHLFWESREGKKCFRIVFGKEKQEVRGCNVLGLRQRHEVWDQWIKEERNIHEVLKNLEKANFDPEFFTKHEKDIRQQFGQELAQKASSPLAQET